MIAASIPYAPPGPPGRPMTLERKAWLAQVWRWWTHARMDTAAMARRAMVPEGLVERDLHLMLDRTRKGAA